MERVVIYARKSDDDAKDQSSSVINQLIDCRKYAEEQGWEIVAEYSDDGYHHMSLMLYGHYIFLRLICSKICKVHVLYINLNVSVSNRFHM